MGNCCRQHESCCRSADEGKRLLDHSGSVDVNKGQGNVPQHQVEQGRNGPDVLQEERKLEEENCLNVNSDVHPGMGGPLEKPPPEGQCTDICLSEKGNHTCSIQDGGNVNIPSKGLVAEGDAENPAVECPAMRVEVNLQSSQQVNQQNNLHEDAKDTFQGANEICLYKAEGEPKEMSLEIESEPLDKSIPVSEPQQDNEESQEKLATCENVRLLHATNTPTLQTDPGAQTEDSEDIGSMMSPEGKPQNTECSEQDAPETTARSKSTEDTKLDQGNLALNLATRLKSPEPEVHLEACKSVSVGEPVGGEPVDGPVLTEVTPLEDMAQDMGVQEQKPEEQGAGGEEDDALKITEAGNQISSVNADSLADPLVREEVKDEHAAPSAVLEMGGGAEEAECDSLPAEEDLYRGEDEIMEEQDKKITELLNQVTVLEMEERCSVMAEVDILSYSEREWRGKTAKSTLIKKGYEEVAQAFRSLCRVRGDNYCALRATLFQMLRENKQPPAWIQEEDVIKLPGDMVRTWRFPAQCGDAEMSGPIEQLRCSLKLLKETLLEVSQLDSEVEKRAVCERVFQGGREEYELLEALKFLMLKTAMELHTQMQQGGDVPVFCLLLFARDTSGCPGAFLANHLSHVGFSGGLEQVEMFLLGYAVQRTIQVYRLYKVDTEEFVTHYPDDHKEDWPCVSLITEDDRHYNVPVGRLESARLAEHLTTS